MINPRATSYWTAILPRLSQVVALQDRNPASDTYGAFAHGADGVFTLSWLYVRDMSDNPFYNQPLCLEWIRAGFAHWSNIRTKSRDLPALAADCFYLCEAWSLIHTQLGVRHKENILGALAQAGERLIKDQETAETIQSQRLALATAALHHISKVTGDDRYKNHAVIFLDRIYRYQSPEGWYDEQGGADPALLTQSLFYLGRIWQDTSDLRLLASLRRALDFTEATLNPDKTLGGDYSGDGRAVSFPAAFEILSGAIASAARLAPAVTGAALTDIAASPERTLVLLLNNLLFAIDARTAPPSSEAPPQPDETLWRDAGWLCRRTSRYHALLGLSRGATLQVWKNEKLVFADCGYWIKDDRKKTFSTLFFQRQIPWQRKDDSYTLEAPFAPIRKKTTNPYLIWLEQGFNLTLGRCPFITATLCAALAQIPALKAKPLPLTLARKASFYPDRIEIEDKIIPQGPLALVDLAHGHRFSTDAGPLPAFMTDELALEGRDNPDSSLAQQLNKGQTVILKRTWKVGD